LIGLRNARGMTQRERARRMDAGKTAVSRDEHNEYHGITVERARKGLEALGVRLVTRVEVEPMGVGGRPVLPRRAPRRGNR
jgi:transcriptional regulator with XRE-family HTH domain